MKARASGNSITKFFASGFSHSRAANILGMIHRVFLLLSTHGSGIFEADFVIPSRNFAGICAALLWFVTRYTEHRDIRSPLHDV